MGADHRFVFRFNSPKSSSPTALRQASPFNRPEQTAPQVSDSPEAGLGLAVL